MADHERPTEEDIKAYHLEAYRAVWRTFHEKNEAGLVTAKIQKSFIKKSLNAWNIDVISPAEHELNIIKVSKANFSNLPAGEQAKAKSNSYKVSKENYTDNDNVDSMFIKSVNDIIFQENAVPKSRMKLATLLYGMERFGTDRNISAIRDAVSNEIDYASGIGAIDKQEKDKLVELLKEFKTNDRNIATASDTLQVSDDVAPLFDKYYVLIDRLGQDAEINEIELLDSYFTIESLYKADQIDRVQFEETLTQLLHRKEMATSPEMIRHARDIASSSTKVIEQKAIIDNAKDGFLVINGDERCADPEQFRSQLDSTAFRYNL